MMQEVQERALKALTKAEQVCCSRLNCTHRSSSRLAQWCLLGGWVHLFFCSTLTHV